MNDFNLTKTCSVCGGDGIRQVWGGAVDPVTGDPVPPGDQACPACNAGRALLGVLEKPSNVFESYLILEELDATEYSALTDAQKAGIDTLLCCGFVDLNVGKAGRVRLVNWFGAGSTTIANLTALLV